MDITVHLSSTWETCTGSRQKKLRTTNYMWYQLAARVHKVQILPLSLTLVAELPMLGKERRPQTWVTANYQRKSPQKKHQARDILRTFRNHRTIEQYFDPTNIQSKWYRNTAAAAACQMLTAWLRRCMQEHKPCNQGLQTCIPARLLHVRAHPPHGDVRFVSTRDTGTRPHATPSYRWGDCTAVKLAGGEISRA